MTNNRERINNLSLTREAYSSSTEQDIHDLIKCSGIRDIDGDWTGNTMLFHFIRKDTKLLTITTSFSVRAVESSYVVPIKSLSSRHKGTHRGHYLQFAYCLSKHGSFLCRNVPLTGPIANVPIDCLFPRFSTFLLWEPSCISGQCNKLLVLCWKTHLFTSSNQS